MKPLSMGRQDPESLVAQRVGDKGKGIVGTVSGVKKATGRSRAAVLVLALAPATALCPGGQWQMCSSCGAGGTEICLEGAQCTVGQMYEVKAMTETTDRECREGAQCTVGQMYEVKAMTETTDRKCRDFSPSCTPSTHYEIAGTWNADRQCIPWSSCEHNGGGVTCSAGAASCTGFSTDLPADQCAAWVAFHDGTSGQGWSSIQGGSSACSDLRTDPCACPGSDSFFGYSTNTGVQPPGPTVPSENRRVCNAANTSVVRM
jgi:hypothetical protein